MTASPSFTCLDGGMGQLLTQRSLRPLSNLWSAEIMYHEPQLVSELHAEFIQAGAEVITLNTYTATPDRLAANGALDWLATLHSNAIHAARTAIAKSGKAVQIAGCLPPLLASYRPDVAPDRFASQQSYTQLVALQNDGVDVFICETMSSILEATTACAAAKTSGKPVWVAFSVSDSHPEQLRGGESLHEAVQALLPLAPDAILLNCSRPEVISKALPIIKGYGLPFGAYANGFESVTSLYPGETVKTLTARTDFLPAQYADFAQAWHSLGASIIGGCCEVTPAHIAELNSRLR
jgi:S-methylmethionine-dependent homocysteine/selenocysteine methylase